MTPTAISPCRNRRPTRSCRRRVGFRGMMNDPLAGFDSTAGADGSFPSPSAIGLYYSVAQGFYDSVSETHVTGARATKAAR